METESAPLDRSVAEALRSYPRFSEACLKIKHKTTLALSPLVPTPAQSHLRELHRRRSIVLKARQEGVSTDVLGRAFWRTITTPNYTTVIISHETDATEKLLMKVRLFYEHLPEAIKPVIEYQSKHNFYWPVLNSAFYIGTAGGTGVGRGDTINFLHLSEMPQWERCDPREVMLGALAAVPPAGEVVIEATARGMGDCFHDLWRKAERGEGRFKPIFMPWMMDPTYAFRLVEGEVLDETLPVEKEWRDYEDKHGLTPEQRKWHRVTRSEFGELFDQEYPATPDVAFLANQRCYFNTRAVQGYRKTVEKPVVVGRLQRADDGTALIEDRDGAVRMWRAPEKDNRPYVIFADVAEGLEHGDYSAAYVYDVWEKDYVAAWHGHVDPDLFADELSMLGRLYSGADRRPALVAVESNNHGLVVLVALKRRMLYPRVYYRKQFDKRIRQDTEYLGWRTDITTKRFMLDILAAAVRDGVVGIFDGALLDELQTFERDERGLGAAVPPNHDDRVMAAAGCLVVSQDIPPRPVPEEPHKWAVPTAREYLEYKWNLREKHEKETKSAIGRPLW